MQEMLLGKWFQAWLLTYTTRTRKPSAPAMTAFVVLKFLFAAYAWLAACRQGHVCSCWVPVGDLERVVQDACLFPNCAFCDKNGSFCFLYRTEPFPGKDKLQQHFR